MVGLMATSSKRAYAVPRSTAPRAPAAVHSDLHLCSRHSKFCLSLWGIWVSVAQNRVCLSPPSISGGYGVLFLSPD